METKSEILKFKRHTVQTVMTTPMESQLVTGRRRPLESGIRFFVHSLLLVRYFGPCHCRIRIWCGVHDLSSDTGRFRPLCSSTLWLKVPGLTSDPRAGRLPYSGVAKLSSPTCCSTGACAGYHFEMLAAASCSKCPCWKLPPCGAETSELAAKDGRLLIKFRCATLLPAPKREEPICTFWPWLANCAKKEG